MGDAPPRTTALPSAFQLDPAADLRDCLGLRRRLEARKEAELVAARNHDALPVLKIATSIARPMAAPARSVGVVVNRVRAARGIHRKWDAAGYRSFLLTGRMRPLARTDVLARIAPSFDPGRRAGRPDHRRSHSGDRGGRRLRLRVT